MGYLLWYFDWIWWLRLWRTQGVPKTYLVLMGLGALAALFTFSPSELWFGILVIGYFAMAVMWFMFSNYWTYSNWMDSDWFEYLAAFAWGFYSAAALIFIISLLPK